MRPKAWLFIAVALAQLALPAWMIIDRERVLTEGAVFKFRTEPVDPRDPFRGEYVVLAFEAEQGEWPNPVPAEQYTVLAYSHPAYASISVDHGSGFAYIASLHAEPPTEGAYLPVRVQAYGGDGDANSPSVTNVSLPFDRFYLEEGEGPRTEALMRLQGTGDGTEQPLPTYAAVRIHYGSSVVEDLVIGGKSVQQWMQEGVTTSP